MIMDRNLLETPEVQIYRFIPASVLITKFGTVCQNDFNHHRNGSALSVTRLIVVCVHTDCLYWVLMVSLLTVCTEY